ncbi:hypothetical protein ASD53_08585 [Lysobacter sp. Root559]|nr:hypothetical protein ASD53_08585 [Lysobacter sp. Root559]
MAVADRGVFHRAVVGQDHVDADVGIDVALVALGHGQFDQRFHVAAVGRDGLVGGDHLDADGGGGAGVDRGRADQAAAAAAGASGGRTHVDLRQVGFAVIGGVVRRHPRFVDFDHRIAAVGQGLDAVQGAVDAHVAGDAVAMADQGDRVALVDAHFARTAQGRGAARVAQTAEPHGVAAFGLMRVVEHGIDQVRTQAQFDFAGLRADHRGVGALDAQAAGRGGLGQLLRGGQCGALRRRRRPADEQRLGGEGGRAGDGQEQGGFGEPRCVLAGGHRVLSPRSAGWRPCRWRSLARRPCCRCAGSVANGLAARSFSKLAKTRPVVEGKSRR